MNKLHDQQLKMKKALIKSLLDRNEAEINAFENVQQSRLEAIDIEEGEPADWYENTNDEVARRMELNAESLEELTYQTTMLRELDAEEISDEVKVGAVVETDNGNFFVAVPANEIEVMGKKFTGVSVKSPFFQAIKGKKEGDAVSFREYDYRIKAVY